MASVFEYPAAATDRAQEAFSEEHARTTRGCSIRQYRATHFRHF